MLIVLHVLIVLVLLTILRVILFVQITVMMRIPLMGSQGRHLQSLAKSDSEEGCEVGCLQNTSQVMKHDEGMLTERTSFSGEQAGDWTPGYGSDGEPEPATVDYATDSSTGNGPQQAYHVASTERILETAACWIQVKENNGRPVTNVSWVTPGLHPSLTTLEYGGDH